MDEMRREILAAMPQGLPRRPALRRALTDDAWFATDLPLFCPEAVSALRAALPDWHIAHAANGWLLLEKELAAPELCLHKDTAVPGEIDCLISLLERHPSEKTDSAALHRLLKAADHSAKELEQEARRQHNAWAALLRCHQSLPGALLPWLYKLEVSP